MKIRHLLTLTVATFLASTLNVAFAAPARDLDETLSKVIVDGQVLDRHAGTIVVDLSKKLLRLNVYEDPCRTLTSPPNVNTCLVMPLRVEQIEVPLQSVELDCGSVIYRGHKDETARDATYQEVEVIDHSGRLCKDLVRSVLEVNAAIVDVVAHETTTYLLMK